MITYDLQGKTALVTGGASGIGFATARMLAKFGATVAINFLADDPRGPEAVDKLTAEGGKAIMAPGSVSEAGGAERMVLKAIDDLGRLDLLFNNAGTPRHAPAHQPAGTRPDHRRAVVPTAANQSARACSAAPRRRRPH